MSQTDFIIHLCQAVAFLALAFFTWWKIGSLESKLLVSEEKKKDDEIDAETKILTDDQLESVATKYFGGSKPAA